MEEITDNGNIPWAWVYAWDKHLAKAYTWQESDEIQFLKEAYRTAASLDGSFTPIFCHTLLAERNPFQPFI